MSINAVGFEEDAKEKMKEEMMLDTFENAERPIYPKAGEDLLVFLLKQRNVNANMAICPRCSVVFDKEAVKAFEEGTKAEAEREKRRIEQERQEVERI